MNRVAFFAATALVAVLAACGTMTPEGAGGTGSPTPSGPGPSGTPTASPTTAVPPTSKPVPGGQFTLVPGKEHDVCGIGVMVTFVPPAGQQNTGYQAFLVGGPVGQVRASGGDNPMPGNAKPANPGSTVTVAGVNFRVHAVDASALTVTLEALC